MISFWEKIIYRICAYLKIPYTFNKIWNANIEIYGRCNLNCKMCGFNGTRAKGIMDFKTFKLAIKELENLGRPIISLHQYGEPLLHPEFGRFINYAKKKKFTIHLYTNGTRLNAKNCAIIKKNPVDAIRVSFSPNKKIYEKIWRNADFDSTVKNLKSFLEESQRWKVKPRLAINLLHEKGANLNEVKKSAEKLFGQWPNLNYQYDEMIKLSGSDPHLKYIKPDPINIPCKHTYTHIAILHNGDVAPCCNDLNGEVILGNIHKDRLKKIRNNHKIVSFRRLINSGKTFEISICKDCPMAHNKDLLIIRDLKKLFGLRHD